MFTRERLLVDSSKPVEVNAELLTQGKKFVFDFRLSFWTLSVSGEKQNCVKSWCIKRADTSDCVKMVSQTLSDATVKWALPL